MKLEFSVSFRRRGFALELAGEFADSCGVFGPSGAGKSTLLKLIAGQTTPDEGRVTLDGRVLFDSGRRVDVPANRRDIGMVFQDCRLFPHLSVRRNILYGLGWFARKKPAMPLSEVAGALDITPLLDKMPHTLSGGEKQRVAIARALVNGPRLLLLDEPFSALDRTVKTEILGYLNRLYDRLGIPYLVISHELGDILQLTEQLYLIDGGRCHGQGAYHSLALPAAHEFSGAQTNVLCCRVDEIAAEDSLVRLRPAGTEASVTLWSASSGGSLPGEVRYYTISPDHIALSLAPVEYSTMQNQLPAVITGIQEDVGGCYISADIGGAQFISEVSRRALQEFGLRRGMNVWLLFKARAFRAGALAARDSICFAPDDTVLTDKILMPELSLNQRML